MTIAEDEAQVYFNSVGGMDKPRKTGYYEVRCPHLKDSDAAAEWPQRESVEMYYEIIKLYKPSPRAHIYCGCCPVCKKVWYYEIPRDCLPMQETDWGRDDSREWVCNYDKREENK
jgi:hypothetical protein